ncbi:hypothetical protein [Psychroserpens sp. Hel_I_66]|uniref:hypothetical protein n=1 Tax=Psychroserpens sp. Hel_I_66 TaxID=1250004 RepID=UPI0006464BDE|nr:hypothetical protein [Psychroserpens sp. Hel_I_66]
MRYFLCLSILASAIFSCKAPNEDSKNSKSELKENYSKLVIIDKFRSQLKLDSLENSRIANFQPLYMGKLKDTIELNYINAKAGHTNLNWDNYKYPKHDDLKIFIDTSKYIGSSKSNLEIFIENENGQHLPEHSSLSYPIFLKNNSTDTLRIGFGDELDLISEAKDSLGNWAENQKRFFLYVWYRNVYHLSPTKRSSYNFN